MRLLERHILPAWHDREFVSIRRSDIAALLDRIEDEHGARQADYCPQHRALDHELVSRRARRLQPADRARHAAAVAARAGARPHPDDDEIRAIWKAAENSGTFGAFVRIALLTAQRRAKVRCMRWADISDAGEWTIPKEPREKDTGGTLVLPDVALAIIEAQPQLGDNPYVFAGRGAEPFNGFSKSKARLDAKLPRLRRRGRFTICGARASSLMSRAGVRASIAERVMGHAIAGVEGVYDRHAYRDEKADALRRLAALIDAIVHPHENVLPMKRKRRKRR